MLPHFGICCRELGGLKVTIFRACVRSFCSVLKTPFSCSLWTSEKSFLETLTSQCRFINHRAQIFGDHVSAFCLSVFGLRISQRFRVDGDNSENTPRLTRISFIRIKKVRSQKYPDTCGGGLKVCPVDFV